MYSSLRKYIMDIMECICHTGLCSGPYETYTAVVEHRIKSHADLEIAIEKLLQSSMMELRVKRIFTAY